MTHFSRRQGIANSSAGATLPPLPAEPSAGYPGPSAERPSVVAYGAVLGLLAWTAIGHAVAVPIMVVAAVSVQAAWSDARTRTIPNDLIAAGALTLVAGIALVVIVDERSLVDVLATVTAGWLLSGGPLWFLVWLLYPATLGGGDWKLLTVQAATVGLVAPYATPLLALGASVCALVYRAAGHRQTPLGPGLAAGYLAAVSIAATVPQLFGGAYA